MKFQGVVLICVLIAGCATASRQRVDRLDLVRSQLKQNVSTKDDVKTLLGRPQNRSVMDYSNANMPKLPYVDTATIMPYEMWTYSWVQTITEKEPGKTFPLLGTIHQTVQIVTINFDRNGIMTGFTTTENDL